MVKIGDEPQSAFTPKSPTEAMPTGSNALKLTGASLSPEMLDSIAADCKRGLALTSIAEKHGISFDLAKKARAEIEGHFDIGQFKRSASGKIQRILGHALEQIEDGMQHVQLSTASEICSASVAAGILIDKLAALNDQPQVVVEHRLRINPESVNQLITNDDSSTTLEAEFTDLPDKAS